MGAPTVLYRRHVGLGICWWCGRQRRRRYAYGFLKGGFCDVKCAGSYHGFDRSAYDRIEPVRPPTA